MEVGGKVFIKIAFYGIAHIDEIDVDQVVFRWVIRMSHALPGVALPAIQRIAEKIQKFGVGVVAERGAHAQQHARHTRNRLPRPLQIDRRCTVALTTMTTSLRGGPAPRLRSMSCSTPP